MSFAIFIVTKGAADIEMVVEPTDTVRAVRDRAGLSSHRFRHGVTNLAPGKTLEQLGIVAGDRLLASPIMSDPEAQARRRLERNDTKRSTLYPQLVQLVRADGGATRTLVKSDGQATRDVLTPIAKEVGETKGLATESRDASVKTLDFLTGNAPRAEGQSTMDRLLQLRTVKTAMNCECTKLSLELAIERRDLLGETPAAFANREAKEAEKAAKATAATDAKEKKAETKKADAAAKRANNAKEKADVGKAKATPKTLAKATPKTRAKATGSLARPASVLATVDDMIKYCNELVEENVEESVTAAAQETIGLLAEYGDDQAQCKVLVDDLIKLAVEARAVAVIVAPRFGAGQWPRGEACEDKTAGGRKCGRKDGCAHRKAYADAEEADQKRAKTQEDVEVHDKFWDKFRGAQSDSVRYWAG
jgi:hypothetical protein